jgi:hypothetical protein
LEGRFSSLIKKIITPFPDLSLTDLEEKFYTYLAEIKVTPNYLPHPFRIKVEISKRKLKNYRWELKLLSSPATVVQVIGQIATLKQLYKDKLACLKGRAKPKDLFDLWYICQKLNILYTPQEISLNKREVVRDLHKYLPRDFWPAIEGLIK